MRWVFPAAQGFILALILNRYLEAADVLRWALWGALGVPIASWLLAQWMPRVSLAVASGMVLLWFGACSYGAYEDPSLGAWEWVPLFGVIGLLFGIASNVPLIMTRSEPFGPNPPHQADPGQHDDAGANPSSTYDDSRDPWIVLGVSADASQSEIRHAFRTRVQQYHPDKVAALGPELRTLANAKTNELTRAYETLRTRNAKRGSYTAM